MIRRPSDYRLADIDQMKGGSGTFHLEHILEATELHEKGRMFARGTLAPGSSVGYHVHTNDMEICFFLSGSGTVMDENGIKTEVSAGDCNICDAGHGHEIINNGSVDLAYLCVILFA